MKKNRINGYSVFSNIFLTISSVIFVMPVIMVVIMSVSSENDIVRDGFKFIPNEFSVEAYRYVLKDFSSFGKAILVTLFGAVIGPFLNIFVNVLVAYPLSIDDFKYKGIINKLLIFIMFVGPVGAASYVISTKYYGLGNNILIYIIPSCSPWTIFLFRTYFKSVPRALVESAQIDGASEFTIIVKILLPLSKAIFAIQYFLGFIGKWNDYYTSLLYMTESAFYNVQHFMMNILDDLNFLASAYARVGISTSGELPLNTMQYAICVFSIIPVILLFPYMQKYFSKGIAVGSVKG